MDSAQALPSSLCEVAQSPHRFNVEALLGGDVRQDGCVARLVRKSLLELAQAWRPRQPTIRALLLTRRLRQEAPGRGLLPVSLPAVEEVRRPTAGAEAQRTHQGCSRLRHGQGPWEVAPRASSGDGVGSWSRPPAGGERPPHQRSPRRQPQGKPGVVDSNPTSRATSQGSDRVGQGSTCAIRRAGLVNATDVRSNDELIQMHNDAGTVQSKTVPHIHKAS